MRVDRRLLSLLVLAVLPLASCFDRPQPACAFFCGEGDTCPEGYSCAPDGWCKRNDVDPSFRCPNAPSDASVDAPAADAAPSDGGVDGGAPDGGAPDAGTPDAGTPDAGTPDAGIPDAGIPDAGTPDAGTPDAGT